MSRLTDHDRFLIRRAREVGPVLRAEGASIRDRLAGQLLDDLADLVERLDSGPDDG